MGVVVISVVIALVVAVLVAGVVVVGMRGELPEVSEKAPELAGRFEWAAKHLNGDAAPSARLATLERVVSRRPGPRPTTDPQGRRTSSVTAQEPSTAGPRRQPPSPGPVGVQPGRLPATGDFGRS